MPVMQKTIQVAHSIINPEIMRVVAVALSALLVAGAFMSSSGREDGCQDAQQADTAPAGASDGSEVQGSLSRHKRAARARKVLSHPPFRI
ncbi:unnamed protein product [Ixodes persulcatus]